MDKQEKFVEKRVFAFPLEMFIELTLSPKDIKKMRQWVKERHVVTPVWFANCERVLFVDWTRFEKWKKKKKSKP